MKIIAVAEIAVVDMNHGVDFVPKGMMCGKSGAIGVPIRTRYTRMEYERV